MTSYEDRIALLLGRKDMRVEQLETENESLREVITALKSKPDGSVLREN